MKALAAFLFRYKDQPAWPPGELRLIYDDGYLDINEEATWFALHEHYSMPKAAWMLIRYHREAANWLEIEL